MSADARARAAEREGGPEGRRRALVEEARVEGDERLLALASGLHVWAAAERLGSGRVVRVHAWRYAVNRGLCWPLCVRRIPSEETVEARGQRFVMREVQWNGPRARGVRCVSREPILLPGMWLTDGRRVARCLRCEKAVERASRG